jgi:copper resistance protein C
MSVGARREWRRAGAVVAALAFFAVLVAVTAGGAHTFLDRSDPRGGAVVRTPPPDVRLWFTGAVEPAYSRVQVVDGAGKRMETADAEIDASHRMLRVPLPPLAPGRYKVVWRVLSIDGHLAEGTLDFSVAP